MRRAILRAVAVLIAASPVTVAVASGSPTAAPVEFKEAILRVETNATDGDAGLQVDLDADPWNRIAIYRPDGRKILDINATSSLKGYGLTELFSESSEPPFSKFPFEKFKSLFPAGQYRLVGRTIDGTKLQSFATLTHNIPAGPEITSPVKGSTVPRAAVVVRWKPVTEPAGIEIVGYHAEVIRQGDSVSSAEKLSLDLPAGATSFTIPAEFLEAGQEYKFEVFAIEAGGNQTLTEGLFTVE